MASDVWLVALLMHEGLLFSDMATQARESCVLYYTEVEKIIRR